ncbi:hypothetical protein SAMN05421767_10288 [Granulicatella balaenopterae]|uniref:ABC-2 type transport system permease protein n=2 Tax=Granulicatella balaenopterae TaxID=137733 RepID=A0A1H9HFK0_9LACT|nr:hypothetical protein SAMN05421767_10288 [Granulicatella balaenopterae]
MLKNKVYLFLLFLPALLAFFMSEGTKGYITQFYHVGGDSLSGNSQVVLYTGKLLFAKTQFAISELNFMVMMVSSLVGLNILEERTLHIWDRIIDKGRFLAVKVVIHYLYCLLMIVISLVVFRFGFGIGFSVRAVLLLATVPIVSMAIGIMAGIFIHNRTVLSNTVMMIVMLFGYFGGALSLSSVLSTTNYMNYLIYLSPLTLINKLLYMDYLALWDANLLMIWLSVLAVLTIGTILVMKRGLKHDTIL